MDIRPLNTEPKGDDLPWKRDNDRLVEQIRLQVVALQSQVDALQRQVN